MSAYRNAPIQQWRVVYRVPLRERVGRAALLALFTVLAVMGPVLLLITPFWREAFVLACVSLMVSVTATVFLAIHWMAHAPLTKDAAIDAVANERLRPSRCRVTIGGEAWSLPVRDADLHVGQRIRVTYRQIASVEADDQGREVVEVKALEE
ncbi:MAG: hypothetical protein U0441_26285 [Polyangiaceae bacterium]